MLIYLIPTTLSLLLSWTETTFVILLITFIYVPNIYSFICSFNIQSTISYLDQINSILIILTLWTSSLILISRTKIKIIKNFKIQFIFIIILLLIILIIRFIINNIILYYIIFEASLIPTLILILRWGYQPERLQASIYLIIYTVSASLPLLASLSYIFYINNSLFIFFTYFFSPSFSTFTLSITLSLAFLVKIPIYISHLWLPKAHVEAPVAGSIILAGVLLKLGSYGLLRTIIIFPSISSIFMLPIISLSLWGLFATAIICIRQQDIKSLIAYSSVGHIGLLIIGIYSMSKWGWEGSIIIIIGHGLSSSALFSLANINYESSNSRSILLIKGLLSLFPSMAIWWFISCAANIAAPPTLNLLAELILITRIINLSLLSIIFLALSCFLAAAYSLILYTSRHHGIISPASNPIFTSLQKNHIVSFYHILPLYIFILSSIYISSLY